jgi:HPt (histidine-containing phosphotransfer) domain-containing protein
VGLTGRPLPIEKAAAVGTSKDPEEETHPAVGETAVSEGSKTRDGQSSFKGDVGLLKDFVSEAREHLETADLNLLTLETEPRNAEALSAVFRAFHTIKGVAGFLELDGIGALAHEAENLLDRARKGELVVEGTAIDVAFDAVDALNLFILPHFPPFAGEGHHLFPTHPHGSSRDPLVGRAPRGSAFQYTEMSLK